MSTVLLALSTRRTCPEVIAAAIAAARERGAALHAAYVLDVVAADRVQKRVGETGFIGEEPCEQLGTTIHEEQEACAREVLADVEAQATAQGLTVTTGVTGGPFTDAVLRLIAQVQAVQAVIAKRPISRFRRFVEGSSAEVIQRTAPCPVTVIEPHTKAHS